jgi:hypothetical protein
MPLLSLGADLTLGTDDVPEAVLSAKVKLVLAACWLKLADE